MKTIRLPYEFLVRWDAAGTLCGAHAQFRYVTTDEQGAIIGEFVGPAEPVPVAGAAGFPLADILTEAQIVAFTEQTAPTQEPG